jgi:hypothetical protein
MAPAPWTPKKIKRKTTSLYTQLRKRGQRVMDGSKAPLEPQELYILVTGANR